MMICPVCFQELVSYSSGSGLAATLSLRASLPWLHPECRNASTSGAHFAAADPEVKTLGKQSRDELLRFFYRLDRW
jgi:hypothetical protein